MCAEPLENDNYQITSEYAGDGAGQGEKRRALQKAFCAHFGSLYVISTEGNTTDLFPTVMCQSLKNGKVKPVLWV